MLHRQRRNLPDCTTISPTEFLPVSERTGAIVETGAGEEIVRLVNDQHLHSDSLGGKTCRRRSMVQPVVMICKRLADRLRIWA